MKVSIALCTYNGEAFLQEQLESLLQQTRLPDEIVIGDDASSDGSVSLAESVLRGRGVPYRLYQNERNLGFVQNFARTIGLTTGDIIFTCDQDDVWMPEKLQVLTDAFTESGEKQLVFSNAQVVDADLQPLGRLLRRPEEFKQSSEAYFKALLQENMVTGATVAFTRSLYASCLPFPATCSHDYWLAVNAALQGKLLGLNQCLIKYRLHDHNTVGLPQGQPVSRQDFLRRRFENLSMLQDVSRLCQELLRRYPDLLSAAQKDNIKQRYQLLQVRQSLPWLSRLAGLNAIGRAAYRGAYHWDKQGWKLVGKDLLYMLFK